jgi:hypothetical protein
VVISQNLLVEDEEIRPTLVQPLSLRNRSLLSLSCLTADFNCENVFDKTKLAQGDCECLNTQLSSASESPYSYNW